MVEFLLENGASPFGVISKQQADNPSFITKLHEKYAETGRARLLRRDRFGWTGWDQLSDNDIQKIHQIFVKLNILHTAIPKSHNMRDIEPFLFFDHSKPGPNCLFTVDANGDTPLHIAIRVQNYKLFDVMYQCFHFDYNKKNNSNISPFEEAILLEDSHIIRALSEYYIKNSGVIGGLRFAIKHGKAKAIHELLPHARFNARKCRQLIHLALREGHAHIAIYLLHHLSVCTYRWQEGYYYRKEEYSLKAKCPFNIEFQKNAEKGSLSSFFDNLCYQIDKKYYIKNLFTAAEHGNVDTVQLYLEAGVDVNVRDDFDETPLFRACSEAQPKIAKILLDHGADVNSISLDFDVDEYTPLVRACEEQKPKSGELISLLIERGADIYFEFKGIAPIHRAVFFGNEEAVKVLIEKDPALVNLRTSNNECCPLNFIPFSKNLEIASLLVSNGANINFQDPMDNTLFHYVAERHQLTIDEKYSLFKGVVELGANPFLMNDDHHYFWQSLSKEEVSYCKQRFSEDGFSTIAEEMELNDSREISYLRPH